MSRFLIAGTSSCCGKTTVTCAVLAALRARGVSTAAFKCGPDYIDPMFHRKALGIPSHNLDGFFCEDAALRSLLVSGSKGCEVSVIEGVMGFFDGGRGSAHSLSVATDTPAALVIGCRGMSESLGAVMKGFLSYRPDHRIKGFVFNCLPERLVPLAKRLCSELGTEFLGWLPKTSFSFESRHLGLVTADETEGISEKLSCLGELAEKYISLDRLLALEAPPLTADAALPLHRFSARIAVARDKAFSFIYEENLELLRTLGCEIVFFSPLADEHLPDADGLILSGGYPELYARELSANRSLMQEIHMSLSSGLPCIAECGGFIYLHEQLDIGGEHLPMVGVIKGEAYKTDKLGRFGYVELTAKTDSLICPKGGSIRSHEFHYFESTNCGSAFTARKPDGRSWECCHTSESLYAGFPHLYFYSDTQQAERFAAACEKFGRMK